MKKFLVNLLLITSSILALNILFSCVIYSFINPALRFQHKIFLAKYDYFKNTDEDFDTLFIGSSKVQNHIIPKLFDSITGHKSFNFGVPQCYPPESTRLLEEILILPKAQKIKRIFIEFQTLLPVKHNPEAPETYYNIEAVYGLETLLFHNKTFDFEMFTKFMDAVFKKYSRALRILVDHQELTETYPWIISTHGYRSLDNYLNFKDDDDKKQFWEKKIIELKDKYKKVPSFKYYEQSLSKGNEEITLYQDYLERTLDAIVKRGIQPILVIGSGTPKNAVFRQHSQLVKKNKYPILDFSSKERYPQLYKFDLFFNQTHFNNKGATLYTNILASKVKELDL